MGKISFLNILIVMTIVNDNIQSKNSLDDEIEMLMNNSEFFKNYENLKYWYSLRNKVYTEGNLFLWNKKYIWLKN